MEVELSIVMPCLNEAETLEICIQKASKFLQINNILGEIIVADNGSTDGSQKIALTNNAVVINVAQKGYGNALKAGFNAAKGKYLIMGDADDSYDFSNLNPFLKKLREGNDLVIGNRFKGGIEKGAMPFLHKYLGNPVLSFLGKLFFKIKINDFHCGLRGVSKEAYQKINVKTTGMEFASEMIVNASLQNLKIIEVPTTLKKDGRTRKPHLKTWSDGWRHLRFLLLFSPNWLFLIPGLLMMILGSLLSLILLFNPIQIGTIIFDIHTLLFSSSLAIVGFQFVMFYGLTKVFGITQNLLPKSKRYDTVFKYIQLEKGLIIGFLLTLTGLLLSVYGFYVWQNHNFKALQVRETMRIVIPAVSLIVIGIQVVLFSFFFSILDLKNEKN
ncbi:glycosyltransferase family 2 protein [Flavobacterium ponti]|uniref:Glycosyltransferase family 2 protein n=1 Tax=Flavobacterium ponti TaxID=665133 RepID=A0ABV9P684_9FLAO